MSQWTALNLGSPVPSPAPVKRKRSKRSLVMETEEALEARLTASYEKTLRSHSKPEVATPMYLEILDYIESLDYGVLSATTKKIQYLCLKNLARLETKANPTQALHHYADALDIDASDCMVWYEAGSVALQLHMYGLSRQYLEEAFALDANFWPMVYKLVLVLYVLHDDTECMQLVSHVLLHDPSNPMALYLASALSSGPRAKLEAPPSIAALESQRQAVVPLAKAQGPRTIEAHELPENTWSALGALLLQLFDEAHQQDVGAFRLALPRSQQPYVIRPAPQGAPVVLLGSIPEEAEGPDDATAVDASPAAVAVEEATPKLAPVVESLRKSSGSEPSSPSTQNRRTSHRTQKRMQDEMAAALKEAKEKDVSYQLLSFIHKEADTHTLEHDTAIYDSAVRVDMAADGTALRLSTTDDASWTVALARLPQDSTPAPSPLQSPRTNATSVSGFPSTVEAYLERTTMPKGATAEKLLLQYLEECAQHSDVELGDDLVRLLLLMETCLLHGTDSQPFAPLATSFACRLFLLEIHVDQLIAGYDPLQHSRVQLLSALERRQQELLRWQLDFSDGGASEVVLGWRMQWLQVHLDEQLGHVDQVLLALEGLRASLGDTTIALGHVRSFPRLSKVAVDRKLDTLALSVLTKQIRDRFGQLDPQTTDVEEAIVELVLPHYDPRTPNAGRIEDLVLHFRLYLRQMWDFKASTGLTMAKPDPPLLSMFVKCLVRLKRFDVCFQVLCLSWYFALAPTQSPVAADKTTVQCLQYLVSQLQLVAAQPHGTAPAFELLLEHCVFRCRDFLLEHFHSSTLLGALATVLPPARLPALVGKILHQLTSIDLRKKANASLLSVALTALQLLYQYLKATEAPIAAPLARALSSSIAVYLKEQLVAGKFKPQSRQLLYASCTSFLLLWKYLDDGTNAADGLHMIELLHDLLTTGDGLEDHGMCCLDGDATFLATAHEILEKTDGDDEEIADDLEEATAQLICCMHGYALLPSCAEHVAAGKDARKTRTSVSDMMAIMRFSQGLDPKHVVRKECHALYKAVLALPDTMALMRANLLECRAITAYVNPVVSATVHLIMPPVSAAKASPTNKEPEPLDDLWYLLATTVSLPKCKRRGKDYNVLFEYESQTLEYMSYLRRDVRVHPCRANAYRLLAASAGTLRALIVDHWNVVWTNHFVLEALPLAAPQLADAPQPTFEDLAQAPFFGKLIAWLDGVDRCKGDADMSDVITGARALVRHYTQYVTALAELSLRCLDMAAALDEGMLVECYEEGGLLLWSSLSERQLAPASAMEVSQAAARYFTRALGKASPEVSLRLNYMLGKVAKKAIKLQATGESVDAWRSVLATFAEADKCRTLDDAGESLPHAYHQLHATRLKLLLQPVLRLVRLDGPPETRHMPKGASVNLPAPEILALVESFSYVPETPKKGPREPTSSTPDSTVPAPEPMGLVARVEAAVDNCVAALERIPLEDKYFHPVYFALARGLFYADALVGAKDKYGASAALKMMKPLFDKKRSQVVSVWLSEGDTGKLEELNQQQATYDRLRLKYHGFYMHVLTAASDYARICDITNWILSSKEEHWVMDAMLAQALVARSYLARGRVLDTYMRCLFPQADDEPAVDRAHAHLHRMYGVYMESQDAWTRARAYNHGSSMGSWIWEVTMAYALAQATRAEEADLLGVNAVAAVMAHLRKRVPAETNETTLLGLHIELQMEARRDWPDLVDNALTYCSTTWPEKTKIKLKPPTTKPKLRLTLHS
ncbi:exonuclease 1 [Achlya hypogyna]|uniref:Exonuclease 1 n=1 Tax=Achlya hypogyna TaxID=1202772 RepID=A0A1V9ZM74_ACHHY|nr:exonuclease 1 [Achlya hypogyna]